MSSPPIQLVLLLAIACSQILGGHSCCCLSRSILESLTLRAEISVPAQCEAVTESQLSLPTCPKCAAATPATSKEPSIARCWDVLAESECNCPKTSVSSSLNTESQGSCDPAQHSATLFAVWQAFPYRPLAAVGRHEVPLRFGGHSWHSMACIWMN